MRIVRTVADLREHLSDARAAGARSVGLVATMGALHEGHLSLIRAAAADCDCVVVSLFVNPTQFGPGEDFESYPRDERRDAALAAEAGVDLLFAPPPAEIYPAGFSTEVSVAGIGDVLCGAPDRRGRGHFDGVATVVARLFGICGPDVAYFGQKDYQQTLVIRRMAADLALPVRIEVCPIVREPDGLALSSRNAYLEPADRRRAPALKRALDAAWLAIAAGETLPGAVAAGREVLRKAAIEPEYFEVLRAGDLREPSFEPHESLVIAVAARVGGARLIDNCLVEVPAPAPDPTHPIAWPASAGQTNGTDPVSGAVTTTK
jgi:pantoate--beta-alanine ligase